MGFPFDSSYIQIALGSYSQRCFLSVIYILNMSYRIVYLHLFYTQQRTSDTSAGILSMNYRNFIIIVIRLLLHFTICAMNLVH